MAGAHGSSYRLTPVSQPSLGGNPTRDQRASVPGNEPANADSNCRADARHSQRELHRGTCLDNSIWGGAGRAVYTPPASNRGATFCLCSLQPAAVPHIPVAHFALKLGLAKLMLLQIPPEAARRGFVNTEGIKLWHEVWCDLFSTPISFDT